MIISKDLKLPDTLHGILRLAVGDSITTERDLSYRFHMSDWHVPAHISERSFGVKHSPLVECEVCMAGAIMAQTLEVPNSVMQEPSDFRSRYGGETYLRGDIWDRLNAVNDMRVGNICTAYQYVYANRPYCALEKQLMEISKLIYTDFDHRLGRAKYRTYMDAVEMLQEIGV